MSAKIDPPYPLPHVSRRALARVKDKLPPPEQCPNCGDIVELVSNSEIYGREYGSWPYAYRCTNHRHCDSHVGLHPHTDLPLGSLADRRTREARRACKALFLEWQSFNDWSRSQSYAWLAVRMGLPASQCHWGLFSVSDAELAGAICEEALSLARLKQ